MTYTHALASGAPILALHMYEHSYHMDYGAKAAAHAEAFMQAVSWRTSVSFLTAALAERRVFGGQKNTGVTRRP